MKTIKGPGIFLAQFIGPQAPFNTLAGMAQWEMCIRDRVNSTSPSSTVACSVNG